MLMNNINYKGVKEMAKITIEELSGSLKEYLNGLGLTEAQVQELIQAAITNIDLSIFTTKEETGDLSGLNTDNKTIIGSINEVDSHIGDLEGLSTTNKSTIVDALNEILNEVILGKQELAQALRDKGIESTGNESFTELANKIRSIWTDITLPVEAPVFEVGVGTITATLDTLEGVFVEFRVNEGEWQTSNVFEGLEGNTYYTFEVKYGAGKTSSVSGLTPKANQAKPAKPVASNVGLYGMTITVEDGYKIRYNNKLYDSPLTLSGLTVNTNYSFYAYKEGTDKLNETISDVKTVKTLWTGPGPQTLQSSSANGFYGYYGTVTMGSVSDFKAPSSRYTATYSGSVTWLKFKVYTATYYIADRVMYSNGWGCSIENIIGTRQTISGVSFTHDWLDEDEWTNTIGTFTTSDSVSHWKTYSTWLNEYFLSETGFDSRRYTSRLSLTSFPYMRDDVSDANIGWRPVLRAYF
jgi:hypothetical protein